MNKRRIAAQSLIALGSLDILGGAALHLLAAYPRVAAALAASNLNAGMAAAMRAVFVMIGCMWIVLAIVALMAAFARSSTGKAIALFCGFALLAQIPIWVRLMGWFVGNEMFLAAGLLIACGGLLLEPAPVRSPQAQMA